MYAAAWCTKNSFIAPNNYLQVDLGAVRWVCSVATQGNYYNQNEWVARYKLTVSIDGVSWNTYQENGINKVSLLLKWERNYKYCGGLAVSIQLRSCLFSCGTEETFGVGKRGGASLGMGVLSGIKFLSTKVLPTFFK